MSAHERVELKCDHPECDEWYQSLEDDFDAAREDAAAAGWRYLENCDVDLCREHQHFKEYYCKGCELHHPGFVQCKANEK